MAFDVLKLMPRLVCKCYANHRGVSDCRQVERAATLNKHRLLHDMCEFFLALTIADIRKLVLQTS